MAQSPRELNEPRPIWMCVTDDAGRSAGLMKKPFREQCQEKHAPDIYPGWVPVFRSTLRREGYAGSIQPASSRLTSFSRSAMPSGPSFRQGIAA